MGWLIGIIISTLVVIGGSIGMVAMPEQAIENLAPVIVFAILDIIFIIKYIRCKNGKAAESKKVKQQKKQELENNRERYKQSIQVLHQDGLSIPQNTDCSIYNSDDKFVITGCGNEFSLLKNKLLHLTVASDVEIQSQYVSSVGGAVGGAVLFGPLGAMIGGRAKQKQTTKATCYIVFAYESDSDAKYLSFKVPEHQIAKAKKWETEFKNTCGNTVKQVEL